MMWFTAFKASVLVIVLASVGRTAVETGHLFAEALGVWVSYLLVYPLFICAGLATSYLLFNAKHSDIFPQEEDKNQ